METQNLHGASSAPIVSLLFWPAFYFLAIVLSNAMMVWLPMTPVLGVDIPPAIFVFGFVFVLRDFAQRALGHYVLAVMAAAAVVTYWFAGPAVAMASTVAFLVSELSDWAIFSITKRPFAQRMLLSSLVSVPVDTAVFFLALDILDATSLMVGIGIKMIGTAIFWIYLTSRSVSVRQTA